jgi:hypothetical protein
VYGSKTRDEEEDMSEREKAPRRSDEPDVEAHGKKRENEEPRLSAEDRAGDSRDDAPDVEAHIKKR